MTSEIGDSGTADMTLRTAMSGRLVFSTLFIEDAPSAVSRLLEMGLEPYRVAAGLKAVLAQRLARRLCPDCRKPRDPAPEELRLFQENQVALPAGAKLYEPSGCPACRGIGYRGRVGLQELLVMEEGLRAACLRGGDAETVRAAARKSGLRALVQDGLLKALEGSTSVREVMSPAV
jgi:type II secretory ATPase GspE/PulE/Tfp pilus assembly ATPase PilB-like protein